MSGTFEPESFIAFLIVFWGGLFLLFVCMFEFKEEEEKDSNTEAVTYLPLCRYRTGFPVMPAATWRVNWGKKNSDFTKNISHSLNKHCPNLLKTDFFSSVICLASHVAAIQRAQLNYTTHIIEMMHYTTQSLCKLLSLQLPLF